MDQNAPQGRIVVGVDGSEPSKRALEWARFVAQSSGAAIDAVMAWHLPIYAGDGGWPGDWDPEADCKTALHQAVEDVLGATPGLAVRELVYEGNTAQVLLEASKDAQVLVVGSRGHGGFTGLLLGSVSATCAEHARCPVLVIHGETPAPSVDNQ